MAAMDRKRSQQRKADVKRLYNGYLGLGYRPDDALKQVAEFANTSTQMVERWLEPKSSPPTGERFEAIGRGLKELKNGTLPVPAGERRRLIVTRKRRSKTTTNTKPKRGIGNMMVSFVIDHLDEFSKADHKRLYDALGDSLFG